jgi:hypothetical protein
MRKKAFTREQPSAKALSAAEWPEVVPYPTIRHVERSVERDHPDLRVEQMGVLGHGEDRKMIVAGGRMI